MPWRCFRLRRSPAVSTRTNVRPSRSKHRVDRVARRARDLGHDHALRAEQGVQERRLADIRAAEDGDTDRLVPDRLLATAWESRHDLVQQVARAVAVQGGERHRVAEAEPVELDRVERRGRGSSILFASSEDGLAGGAQDRGELLVAGCDARPRVDDEEHEVRLFDAPRWPARR